MYTMHDLPVDVPLMCDASKVAEIFGICKTTLYTLRRKYPDFPARKIGRRVLYPIPEIYEWVKSFPGGEIPTE